MKRIDIHVEVPRVEYEKLTGKGEAEPPATAPQRVLAARERQARRFAGHERVRVNAEMGPAEMGPAEVCAFCEVDPTAQPLLHAAAQRLQRSARAFHRVLELAGADASDATHIQQTLSPHEAERESLSPE